MEKKYIVIAVVVVALWGAFMGYRHLNRNDGQQAHQEDTYGRLLDMAKKSPNAGLVQMGRALNKFYQDHKKFPARLDELYPQYIPSRAFIGEINWEYASSADNFELTKRGMYNNREMVASMDKTLRPELDTGTAVAQRPETPAKRPARRAPEAPTAEEPAAEVAELEIVNEVRMTGAETSVVMAAVGADAGATEASPSTALDVQREMSKVVTRLSPEIESAETTGFATNLERYLVWKDMDGAIGISNIQFPEAEKMYVAITDRWYSVKRRKPERSITAVIDSTTEPVKPMGVEQVAQNLTREYLVWKDDAGTIGIGNIQYPEAEKIKVVSDGQWQPMRSPSEPPRKPARPAAEAMPEKKTGDEIAAGLSSDYLVWKDESGAVGFGNVQFPDRQRLTIASNENWQTIEREAAPRPTDRATATSAVQQEPSAETDLRFLMWKDKNGHIGYGNVQYPEMREISYIHSDRNWEKVVN